LGREGSGRDVEKSASRRELCLMVHQLVIT
jgi:hypothetical protein